MQKMIVAFALGGLIGTAAQGASIDVSTGLNSSSSAYTTGAQADAHWTVNGAAAQTTFPSNADWHGGWLPNSSNVARPRLRPTRF